MDFSQNSQSQGELDKANNVDHSMIIFLHGFLMTYPLSYEMFADI